MFCINFKKVEERCRITQKPKRHSVVSHICEGTGSEEKWLYWGDDILLYSKKLLIVFNNVQHTCCSPPGTGQSCPGASPSAQFGSTGVSAPEEEGWPTWFADCVRYSAQNCFAYWKTKEGDVCMGCWKKLRHTVQGKALRCIMEASGVSWRFTCFQ